MKAISLWQPWASLWACGRKQFETRHWATSHRGRLLVHAAQKICSEDISEELREICEDEFGGHWAIDLPRGALIAGCFLVNCIPTAGVNVRGGERFPALTIDAEERAQGDFTPGRFAWESQNMQLLDRPIPWRGRQGLFDVPDYIITGAPEPPNFQNPQARLL